MNRKTSETNLFDVYQNTAQALATLIDPKIPLKNGAMLIVEAS